VIEQKKLQRKAMGYAKGVVGAVKKVKPSWTYFQRLLEAAYFNGFQSGVCWQMGQIGLPPAGVKEDVDEEER
jgi:hypothetical protein